MNLRQYTYKEDAHMLNLLSRSGVLISAVLLFIFGQAVNAATSILSSNGNDAHPETEIQPPKTLNN